MENELIDIYDENNNSLNIKKTRKEVRENNLWHRTIQVLIYNSKEEIMLQLRAKDKKLFPDLWDFSVAGHIDTKDTPIDTTIREIGEEIGLKVKKEELQFYKIKKLNPKYKQYTDNKHAYVFLLKKDIEIKDLKIQKEEVQELKWISLNNFEKELKTNGIKYVPHGEYWFEIIEKIRGM